MQPKEANLKRIKVYKWLKLGEAISLLAAGITFCCFYDSANFTKAIGYGFAVILLVYGIIELCGSILLRRSVLSSEIFLDIVVVAFAAMLLRFSNELAQNSSFNLIITWIFGFLLAGYAIVLLVSGVFNVTPEKREERQVTLAVVEFVSAGLIIGLDVILWYFGLRSEHDQPNQALSLIVGISVILLGISALCNMYLANSTQKLFKKLQGHKEPEPQPRDKQKTEEFVAPDVTDEANKKLTNDTRDVKQTKDKADTKENKKHNFFKRK